VRIDTAFRDWKNAQDPGINSLVLSACPICQTQTGQADWPFSLSRHVLVRPQAVIEAKATEKIKHTLVSILSREEILRLYSIKNVK